MIRFQGNAAPLSSLKWLENPANEYLHEWLKYANDTVAQDLSKEQFLRCMHALTAIDRFPDDTPQGIQEQGFGWVKALHVLSRLCHYCTQGEDLESVDSVIKCLQKWQANGLDLQGILSHQEMPPIHFAADHGASLLCRALIELGVPVDQQVSVTNRATALYHAASAGHECVVELLLKQGANVDAGESDPQLRGVTPLIAGVAKPKVVEVLVRHCANVNARCEDLIMGPTALDKALRLGKYKVVPLLTGNDQRVEGMRYLNMSAVLLQEIFQRAVVPVQEQAFSVNWLQVAKVLLKYVKTLDALNRAFVCSHSFPIRSVKINKEQGQDRVTQEQILALNGCLFEIRELALRNPIRGDNDVEDKANLIYFQLERLLAILSG